MENKFTLRSPLFVCHHCHVFGRLSLITGMPTDAVERIYHDPKHFAISSIAAPAPAMDETQFNHSVKVPMQYRAAARLLKKTFEQGASLKGLIFQEKHAVIIVLCDGCI